MSDSVFANNTALTQNGGGILHDSFDSPLVISNTTFRGNRARGCGGGVAVKSAGLVAITNSSFGDNSGDTGASAPAASSRSRTVALSSEMNVIAHFNSVYPTVPPCRWRVLPAGFVGGATRNLRHGHADSLRRLRCKT